MKRILLSLMLICWIGIPAAITWADEPYWQGYDDAQEGYWQRSNSNEYLRGYDHGQGDLETDTAPSTPTPAVIAKPVQTVKKKRSKKLTIRANRLGGYQTIGIINGKEVNFIIDTGATYVSLSKSTAKRLRLKYAKTKSIRMQTAAGIDRAYLTTIKKITIGSITLRDVPAAITTHDFPANPLLGMSFLGQLEMRQEDAVLVLRKR